MKTVPFYSFDEDDTHCFQSAFKMVLKYFLPKRHFSWKELEEMSAKIEGKSTWPQQMLIHMQHMGFEVISVGAFDGKAFIKEGNAYLRRAFGGETAEWQIQNSDIAQEQRLYRKYFKLPGIKDEVRIPTIAEMKTLLELGYLIISVVNSRKLKGKDGYIGHSIVIFDITDTNLHFHDPGPPPVENRQVTYNDFEAAWADPNEEAKNFIAIKLKDTNHA